MLRRHEAELDAVEHDIDQLTSRAGSVNSGLDNLARQQAAAGYGLRGDMAAKQASMKLNLSKAQDAISHNDAKRAKRYAEMAGADIEALEKFLASVLVVCTAVGDVIGVPSFLST